MQIYIDSYGAFFGVEEGMFYVKPKNSEGRRFALREVTAILLTKGVRVTTDAMLMAMEAGIPILILDEIGHPVGQVWSGQYGSIATIRKNQALFSNHLDSMVFMRGVLLEKLDKQAQIISDLGTGGRSGLGIIEKMREKFVNWRAAGQSVSEVSATFRGWEGTVSRQYFLGVSAALPEVFRFGSRSRRPARDAFNALLNYLYGVLYAQVRLAVMKAGLDPYMGFLHADQYNSPSLVFDMIEPVRHWAELAAIEVCVGGLVGIEDFEEPSLREGFLLRGTGKAAAIAAIQAKMQEKVLVDGLSRRRLTHLDYACSRLAGYLKGWG